MFDEVLDFVHEVFDAREGAATNGFLRDDPKPALHLVQPGGVGGRVVDVEAGPLGQPGTNLGVLVGAVVRAS